MCVFGTMTDETVTFFKTNTPYGGSTEDIVKVYALGGVSPYNKYKVYTLIGSLPRECV